MERKLLITFALCYISVYCQGLEFSLKRDFPVTMGARNMCGLLLCHENVSPTVAKVTAKEGRHNLTRISAGNLLSMAIFRKQPTLSITSDHNEYRGEVLLASVTARQPNITRVKNGVKLSGVLEPQRATMRVELFNPADCLSEFTCQVTGVDVQRRSFLSTSTLLQQPKRREIQQQSERLASTEPVQSLAKQLDSKMEAVKTSVEHLQDDMVDKLLSIERRFEDKIGAVEKDFQRQVDSLENLSFERRLEDKLDSLENRIGDKIEHTILEKLYQIDAKMSALNNAGVPSEKESVLLGRLSALLGESTCDNQGHLQALSDQMSALLSSLESSLVGNLTELAGDVGVLNDIITKLRASQQNFRQLEASSAHENSTETQCAAGDLFTQINTTLLQHLKPAILDLLTPKTCEKGMITIALKTPYPHPLIQPSGELPGYDAPFLCDTTTDGGGWMLIQRRTTGHVDFYRDWAAYKQGFGTLDDDFWLGNDRIHTLTSQGTWELRVDLTFDGKEGFAHYDTFNVADEKNKYTLTIGNYDGTAGDSLRYHNSRPFSTFDRDNDNANGNCAVSEISAWWYNACDKSDLNSKWNGGSDKGLEWNTFTGQNSASSSEMKIRRVDQ